MCSAGWSAVARRHAHRHWMQHRCANGVEPVTRRAAKSLAAAALVALWALSRGRKIASAGGNADGNAPGRQLPADRKPSSLTPRRRSQTATPSATRTPPSPAVGTADPEAQSAQSSDGGDNDEKA